MFESNAIGAGDRQSETPYRSVQPEPRQRLVFTRGASRVTLESMRGGDDVIETDFDGACARVTRTPNEVRIGYDWSFLSYAYDVLMGGPTELPHSTLGLSESHVWELQCRGGVSSLDARLDDLRISEISIRGGASDVFLSLGRPSGVVPIRIRGGVSHLELRRPKDIGVRLSVRGGIGRLVFDEMELDAVGGGLVLHSRAGADAPERYDIEIGGGVSDLVIV